jgi:type II secretory pathway pseudopilin PulG
MKTKTNRRNGLSLIELAVVLATVAVVIAFVLPIIFRPRATNGRRISCVNNLKQVGLSYRLWLGDHNDEFPFISTNNEGSRRFANSPEVFRHFLVMSNEINTPKILVCPSDFKRTRATDFSDLSNTNLSYFVGLDADESKPERLLSGDRNITGGTLSNGFLRLLRTNSTAGWTTEIHTNAGDIGLADGSVQQMNPQILRRQLQIQSFNNIRLAIP